MQKVAKFEKVSFEQFKKDTIFHIPADKVESAYSKLALPKRATQGSAGYDFKMPFYVRLEEGDSYLVPTGVRVNIKGPWVLQVYPRSGLGFKYRLQLDNSVGIIDSDYYNSKNEGHIFAKITNDGGNGPVTLDEGDSFIQGIFIEYGITEDDDVDTIRDGGFGSTDK